MREVSVFPNTSIGTSSSQALAPCLWKLRRPSTRLRFTQSRSGRFSLRENRLPDPPVGGSLLMLYMY
ncbi:MAG: hypothetical protein HY431_00450 [Candidatus Levybacteria bacterium]|nr:hypothetical protein [Candidatus Levybacteria bacterium]